MKEEGIEPVRMDGFIHSFLPSISFINPSIIHGLNRQRMIERGRETETKQSIDSLAKLFLLIILLGFGRIVKITCLLVL